MESLSKPRWTFRKDKDGSRWPWIIYFSDHTKGGDDPFYSNRRQARVAAAIKNCRETKNYGSWIKGQNIGCPLI